MKRKIKYQSLCLFVLSFVLLAGSITQGAFASSSSYLYSGEHEFGTRFEIETEKGIWQKPTVYKLSDARSLAELKAYCIQWGIPVKENVEYNIVPLEGFASTNHQKIRAIMNNTYPFVSVDTFRASANAPTLTKEEIIAGTQIAIWETMQGIKPVKVDGSSVNVRAAYTYLINQNGMSKPQAGSITISPITLTRPRGNVIRIEFSYSTTNNHPANLQYTLHGLYGFSEVIKEVNGNTTLVALERDYTGQRYFDRFECGYVTVRGTQDLTDVFVLTSTAESQPLVSLGTVGTFNLQTVCKRLPAYNPPITAEQWRMCKYYSRGDLVSYNGSVYQARYSHVSWNWFMNPEWAWGYWVRVR